MKAGLISAAAMGLATVAASHHARHEQFHKREVHIETVTDYITDVQEEIVVYVGEDGKPVASSTFWKNVAPHTPAPAPVHASVSAQAPPPAPTTTTITTSSAVAANFLAGGKSAPAQTSQAAPSTASKAASSAASEAAQAAPEAAKSAASSAVAAVSSAVSGASHGSSSGSIKGGIGFGNGVSYSPYHANNDCKTPDEIKKDLAGESFDVIRLYGTDCKQVENTLDALSGTNTQLFVGIFDVGSAQSEAQTIINAVKNHANGDWSKINTVNVGNEVVNSGGSVSQVTNAVGSVRSQLRSAGFNGPVVTVDTMVAHRSNPELCEASDFCAINCHAFFDGNTMPEAAGPFVLGWVQQIAAMHTSKQVLVTESGWPSKGSTNGKAVPSESNQKAAIDSLKGTFSSNLILFSLFNTLWKKSDAAQFNAEQWWGIKGDAPVN